MGGNIYLAMSLRNVGSGIAVLHGWWPSGASRLDILEHADPGDFRMQTRDMIIPAGDISFWQGAIRDPEDAAYAELTDAITTRRAITVELLYGDHEGGQRAISRFHLVPRQDEKDPGWMCTVVKHWNLDRPDPR